MYCCELEDTGTTATVRVYLGEARGGNLQSTHIGKAIIYVF